MTSRCHALRLENGLCGWCYRRWRTFDASCEALRYHTSVHTFHGCSLVRVTKVWGRLDARCACNCTCWMFDPALLLARYRCCWIAHISESRAIEGWWQLRLRLARGEGHESGSTRNCCAIQRRRHQRLLQWIRSSECSRTGELSLHRSNFGPVERWRYHRQGLTYWWYKCGGARNLAF